MQRLSLVLLSALATTSVAQAASVPQGASIHAGVAPYGGTPVAQMTDNVPVSYPQSPSCYDPSAGTTYDNSWWRRFYFSEHGAPASVVIESVTVATESGPATPITVRLYTIPHSTTIDTIPRAALTPIGIGVGTSDGTPLALTTIPVAATVADAVGTDLVVEYHIDSAAGAYFHGANRTAQTHPSFFSSELCGLNEPLPLDADLGYADSHSIIVVNLSDECTAEGICLAVTLGTDTSTGACGTAGTLDVEIGDQINYCYTVTNNSGVGLDYHSLTSSVGGQLFSLLHQPLANGETYQYNRIVTVNQSETVTATWTARAEPPNYSPTVKSAEADRLFCDGFDEVACGSGTSDFIDITATGTATGLDNPSHGIAHPVTMPFPFTFYDTTSDKLVINSYGGVVFDASIQVSVPFNNQPLPNYLFNPAILPLWDHFSGQAGLEPRGEVYYEARGTAPNRQFIIEWFDRPHAMGESNTDTATYELILNENGTIQFEYADVAYTAIDAPIYDGDPYPDPEDCSGGLCATIGLFYTENLYRQFSAFEASVTDNSGITWTPDQSHTFTAAAAVALNVGAPDINVVPGTLSGTVSAGASRTARLDIQNFGNRDLVWTTDEAPSASHLPSMWHPRYSAPAVDATQRARTMLQTAPTADVYRPSFRTDASVFGTAMVPAYTMSSGIFVEGRRFGFIDAAAPSTFTAIAPAPSALYKTATFIDNDFTRMYVASTSNTLATIDTLTGALTLLPNSSAPTVSGEYWMGLKWDAWTRQLFGAGCDGATGCHLYMVNPATGSVVLGPAITGIDLSGGRYLLDIAIDPSGLMYGVEAISGDFIAIDKTTGVAAAIGNTGVLPAYVQSLDFDPSTGLLYWASFSANYGGRMFTIDPTTGLATMVGEHEGLSNWFGMAIAVESGPCGAPADQPWLSISPASGTIPGGTYAQITVTIDAAGYNAGDVLSGAVCVRSNDRDERTVTVPVSYTVGNGGG